MNLDDMSAERIARYVANTRTSLEVWTIGRKLSRLEAETPGTILAVAGMTPEKRQHWLWSLRSGGNTHDVDLELIDAEWSVTATSDFGDWSISRVTPTRDAPPVPLVNDGHCPQGNECSICRFEAKTPEEKAAWYRDNETRCGKRGAL